jgi:hypothetical protein
MVSDGNFLGFSLIIALTTEPTFLLYFAAAPTDTFKTGEIFVQKNILDNFVAFLGKFVS